MIEARALTFSYPGAPVEVFASFGWRVERGESWAVIGPSGCGKTTLLYLLAGLLVPTAGGVFVDGRRVDAPRPRTGLILQDYGLLPWATVRQNVRLGLQIRAFYGPDGKHAPADAADLPSDENVTRWLRRLGIEQVADKYPSQISGGQRQRTAIARTMVLGPDLLLMDEPFSSLDALTRERLQVLVLGLLRDSAELTTVLVTHSIDEAVFLARKILVLCDPPNREPRVVDNPGAGDRGSGEFAARCGELRSLLGDAGGGSA